MTEEKNLIEVHITNDLYQRLMALTNECDSEVGGILLGEINEGKVHLDEVIIPKQTVSSAHVEMNMEEIANAISPMITKKPEIAKRIKGWWHTHYDFGTFWSVTDEKTINKLTEFMGLCISVNTNQKGSMKVRIDMLKPFGLTFDDLNYKIVFDDTDKYKKWAEKEVKTKIEMRKFTAPSNYAWKWNKKTYTWDKSATGKEKEIEHYVSELIPAKAFQHDTLQEFIRDNMYLWRKSMTKEQKRETKRYFKAKIKTTNRVDNGYTNRTQEEFEENEYNKRGGYYYD